MKQLLLRIIFHENCVDFLKRAVPQLLCYIDDLNNIQSVGRSGQAYW